MILLKESSKLLLEKCMINQNKNLLYIINSDELVNIDEELGNELRNVVGDELITNGFDGDVPNKYGLALENLIDEIGRLHM